MKLHKPKDNEIESWNVPHVWYSRNRIFELRSGFDINRNWSIWRVMHKKKGLSYSFKAEVEEYTIEQAMKHGMEMLGLAIAFRKRSSKTVTNNT